MKKYIIGTFALLTLSFSSLSMADPANYCPPGWHIGGSPLACQPPSHTNDFEE